MAFYLTIPGNPVPKGRPRFRVINSKFGKPFVSTYTPKDTTVYEERVARFARTGMANRKPIENKPLKVVIVAYLPIPKTKFSAKKLPDVYAGNIKPIVKPDLDNIAKSVIDACNGIIWKDDNLICSLTVKKEYALKPRVDMSVSIIKPEIIRTLL